jgi:hypothetical protein
MAAGTWCLGTMVAGGGGFRVVMRVVMGAVFPTVMVDGQSFRN